MFNVIPPPPPHAAPGPVCIFFHVPLLAILPFLFQIAQTGDVASFGFRNVREFLPQRYIYICGAWARVDVYTYIYIYMYLPYLMRWVGLAGGGESE